MNWVDINTPVKDLATITVYPDSVYPEVTETGWWGTEYFEVADISDFDTLNDRMTKIANHAEASNLTSSGGKFTVVIDNAGTKAQGFFDFTHEN